MQAFFRDFTRAVSYDRLDSYRRGGPPDHVALGRYLWNMALCEALYPALHAVEIALRNNIHRAAYEHYNYNELWFDTLNLLDTREIAKIVEARTELQRNNKPLNGGRIVAELGFGFWTSLLDSRYEQTLIQPLLPRLLPHAPPRHQGREELRRRMERVRRLRNRAFHHEHIWHWGDLDARYEELLETLDWMSPCLHQIVVSCERFRGLRAATNKPFMARARQLCPPVSDAGRA